MIKYLDRTQSNQWLIEIQPIQNSSVISPVHKNGDYSAYFLSILSDTNLPIYLKSSIQTLKYSYFEIKNLQNSDLASSAKFSVSKITRYTLFTMTSQDEKKQLSKPLQQVSMQQLPYYLTKCLLQSITPDSITVNWQSIT